MKIIPVSVLTVYGSAHGVGVHGHVKLDLGLRDRLIDQHAQAVPGAGKMTGRGATSRRVTGLALL